MPELVDERSPVELHDEINRLRTVLNEVRWFLAGVRDAAWLDPVEMIQRIDATMKGENTE